MRKCYVAVNRLCLLALFLVMVSVAPLRAQQALSPWDEKVKEMATECAQEIVAQYEQLISSGQLNQAELFDTFYVPIKGSDPPKFHTKYDTLVEGIIGPILDKYAAKDPRLHFVIVVDKNGYAPTHNTKYAQPLTGEPDHDFKFNRTKRMFADRVGLTAARNTEAYLMQSKEDGERRAQVDMSVPIYVQKRHWGAVRISYRD
jgi:methyl-accepting chemotaxis protein